MEQHERALAAYVDSVREQPGALAVVAIGSVAQGREREDSDVDVYFVVDDERFAAETAAGRFAWIERYGVDYPGSYIDVKLASPAYLETAAQRADDPTRASFRDARVAWSVLPGIEQTLERIVTASRRRVGRTRALARRAGAAVRRLLPSPGGRARRRVPAPPRRRCT